MEELLAHLGLRDKDIVQIGLVSAVLYMSDWAVHYAVPAFGWCRTHLALLLLRIEHRTPEPRKRIHPRGKPGYKAHRHTTKGR